MRDSLFRKICLRLLKESTESKTDLAVLVHAPISDERPVAVLYDPVDLLNNLDEVLDPDLRARIFGVADIIKGVVSVRPIPQKYGHCYGAWQINYIAGPEQGRILYPIAHALCPTGLLTPDRKDVSDEASPAWEKSLKLGRPRKPFDDYDAHGPGGTAKYDHPNHTDDPSDDCVLHPGRDHLNWAYEMAGGEKELLARLVTRHKEVMSEISPALIQQVEDIIKEEGDIFADKHLRTR